MDAAQVIAKTMAAAKRPLTEDQQILLAGSLAVCLEKAVAAERERWEKALKQSWQAIDPIRPAGQPGSYARGYDNGFAAALEVLRGNLRA